MLRRWSFYNFLFLLFSITVSDSLATETNELELMRKAFYSAVEDEKETEVLFSQLKVILDKQKNNAAPIIIAYYGATETLLGKHALNPYKKWNKLKSGLEKIAAAIEQNPKDLEIRFLRFSILHHLPSFLGFSDERNEDKGVIYNLLLQKNYSALEFKIQKGIIEFMIESERLSKSQNARLRKLLDE